MSIDLTELFTRLGRCADWTNVLLAQQNAMFLGPSGELVNLQSAYLDRLDLVQGFTTQVIAQANQMANMIGNAITVANSTLADLQAALNSPSPNPNTILPLLYEYMVENSATIQRTIINSPVVTPNGGNVGNGVLLVSTLNAMGITDERIINQDVQLTCTQSQWSGGTAGAEQFSIVGWPSLPSPANYGIPGNGNGASFPVSDASSPNLNNGGFETWTGIPLQPSGWTKVSPTVAANVVQSSTPHNSNERFACALTGDGSTATIKITQNIQASYSAGSLTVYCAGVWLRKSGTVGAGSTITVDITGTGVSTQTVASIDPATLTTSYQLYYLFFATSVVTPPSDWTFNITWSSANTAGASAVILVDDANLVQPVAFGRAQLALFRGSSDFAVGDVIDYTTSIYSAGVFSSWFARFFNQILPTSNSPSISDALAT